MSEPLVERLRRGDSLAYREAVELYGASIYGFLVRMSRDRALAEDLAQDTWIALARSARSLEMDTRLLPWLYTVARNAYRSHRRWALLDPSRWLVAEPSDGAGDSNETPEMHAMANQTRDRLERAMAKLEPNDREALLLGLDADLTSADRAKIAGVSDDAYRQRLHRARAALAEELRITNSRGAR